MRTFTRAAVVGLLAGPALFLASGVAQADESSFCKVRTAAGEHGAFTERVCSQAESGHDFFDRDFRDFRHQGLLDGLLGGIL